MNRPFSPWKRALQEAAASLLILCLTLTLTVIAWRYTAEEIEKETRVHFDSEVRAAKEALNRRLQAYIDALHALQSLFAVRDNVTRAEWRGYIESLDLQKRYPGIYYFAFARYVPKAEKADFERQVRNDASLKKEGYPGFSIKPAGDRAEYFPIDYLEPYSSAWGQFGFDIGSDPVQYAAIERACDTGDPAATGRVVLDATSQPGFSIRLPVYRKGAPHRTVEERRGALLGFVSSAFNMSDLMGGVFGHQVSSDLDFEVYDIEPMANLGGAEPLTEDRLLYDNDTIRHADDPAYHPRYRAVTTLNVAGRAWSLYFSTRPHFGAGPQDRLPRLVLFGGTVISLLLFGMIWSQGTSRRRALDLAGAITADLRKSEEQYRLLFDRNPHPMWVFDRETLAFLAVNEAAVRHYGYSRNEFLAMTIKDIRPAEEIPALLNYKAVAAANPAPSELGRTGVWRHLKKDGTLIDVEIVWSPISFKGRDATLVLVDDVTDRRRAERALSESQRVLSTLMSNLPGMAYRCKNDPEWTIEFVSEGCLDLTGYHPSDLIGNKTVSYGALIYPDDQGPVWDDVQAALSEKKPFQLVYRIRARTGVEKWVWEQGRGVFSPGGDLLALEGFVVDITERKRAEEAVRQSEERYRTLMEQASDGIFIADHQGKYIDVNNSGCAMLGYSREEILRMGIADLIPSEELAARPLKTAELRLGKALVIERRVQRKDGAILTVEVSAKMLTDGRFIGIVRDVTKRKLMEEALFNMVQGVSTSTGETFFRSLVRHLTKSLGVDYAFVGKLSREKEGVIKTIAVSSGGNILDNFEYRLTATPCETVVGKRVCSYPSDAAKQFPNDLLLAKMGIEAYIGAPLFDSAGDALGLIVVLNRSPLSDLMTIESMLQVFAARAASELERSRAEEAVRQSEERHRTLMEQASDGIFIADIQGKYIDVNSSGCAMLGYSREEILGMNVADLLSIEAISTVPLLLEELRSGRIMIIERLLKRKDGKLLAVEISAKMLSGQRLQSIVRDITERRRSEERLKNSEKRFRALIENSSDAILLAGPNGTILYCGPSTGRIVGYSIDELLGRNGFEFMHPDDVERTMKMFSDLIQTPGSVAAAEYRFRQKDGSWRWMEGIGTNLLDEPGVHAIVANLRDITDRKLAEEQLERSREQLRNLSTRLQSMREEERTRIAREIHDELGQMLTVLKMEIALMMTKLPPGQKRLQGKMKSMSLLIDQTIQRVRKIATELRPGVLDDLGLPAAVEWQTQEFQSRTGIQCRLTLHPEEMTLDPARSTAIFRIFQETLTNVARHANADRVKIRLVEEGGRLVLEVADNGKGITESQISNSKSLGILGIRERALLWGGEVKIEGVPGKGTTVTAQIPLPEFSEDEDKERHVKDPHRG